ncbi:hypothetical protein BGX31_006590 [Mortierella sp. GBA43]|nr:hypothetical protein BGX31_006590 [Mortierella sp. GBA43]
MADDNSSSHAGEAQLPMDLTLARAAAAFRDADFFEACVLFWSAALDHHVDLVSSDPGTVESLAVVAAGLDLEQELGLDVQAQEPIDLVFPTTTSTTTTTTTTTPWSSEISPIQNYILTALCYLARHINIRIDILPSGQDTLTSLGPPQRYYISLTAQQKQFYHDMLTTEAEAGHDQEQLRVEQTTSMGNTATVTWQTSLTQKRTPHSLPRFFSFLNSSSCTVAGCSIPRNEIDVDALEQAGFRLVITMIRESPLSPAWFQQKDPQDSKDQPAASPKRIRNAFVPIENRKAPEFPEVFEVLMGWCLRTGNGYSLPSGKEEDSRDDSEASLDHARYPHQRATLIHCGGGKGRAGIVLAAHLIRFGLIGHEGQGYCVDCIQAGNVHPYDLDQFRKGLGDKASASSTLPKTCSSVGSEQDTDEEDEEDFDDKEICTDAGVFRPVRSTECINRYQPLMTAKDAIAHLRELRPGSIESVEQEKAIKAYGDWLWKRSSSKSSRSSRSKLSTAEDVASPPTNSDPAKHKKDSTKDHHAPKPKPSQPPPPPAAAAHEDDDDLHDYSDDDYDKGRKSGKKGKKGSRKMPQEPPKVFVPPPADKIIKIPGSQHHQHHLVVQHNMRARQLQRGQKSKKNSGGGGKQPKERPSFQVSGAPLNSAPKLVILAGLPGSGKSHLVTSLLSEFPEHFVRISQDELGSRAVCERLLAQSMRHQQQSIPVRGAKNALPMTVFVDRCNPTMAERKEWYEVAFQPNEAIMVWFSKGADACIERVDAREGHPTVAPGMGSRVVKAFAKGFELPNLAKEGSWCQTLVEVGDDEGSDRLAAILKKFAKEVPASSSRAPAASGGNTAPTPVKARPAFIPAKVLQRKANAVADTMPESPPSPKHPKLSSTASMESVEEEDEEEEEEEEESPEKDSRESGEEGEEGEAAKESDHQDPISTVGGNGRDEGESQPLGNDATIVIPPPPSNIVRALQFASPTGHRPAVKKPAKGSWKGTADTTIDVKSTSSSSTENGSAQEVTSPKGVSFATPLSSYDRPLQKFPRTPHLFDPLTILQSHAQGTDRVQDVDATSTSPSVGRSTAISRSDLLLPPSAIRQVFAPKPQQRLTVEEKIDGANIGFSVLHFKTMNGFAGISAAGPPPKIRIQNRNHFVHPDDHWQFKKLDSWLEKHREDILWLCEGRWRYESRKGNKVAKKDGGGEGEEEEEEEEEEDATKAGDNDDADEDDDDDDDMYVTEEDEDENEYVDEDRVLQDGLAPYVLYGEWLYAKHSVHYTGLRSWFVPFDLYDVKTGTYVSRAVFRKAIAQTQLPLNPIITIPDDICGNVDKTLRWVLQTLQSRSALMKSSHPATAAAAAAAEARGDNDQCPPQDRVEGLYFRIDQGDRLLMRSKVVRPDFIAGEERWGSKEQVANKVVYYEEAWAEESNVE